MLQWSTRNDSACFALHSGVEKADNCPATPSPGAANARGLLWSNGTGDTGEDGTTKFCRTLTKGKWTDCDGVTTQRSLDLIFVRMIFEGSCGQVILSMDMAGYSVDMRRTIARISGMQGDAAAESKWLALAEKVAAAAKAALWRPELSAMFDKYEDDTCKDMPLDLNREWLDLPRSQNRMVGQG